MDSPRRDRRVFAVISVASAALHLGLLGAVLFMPLRGLLVEDDRFTRLLHEIPTRKPATFSGPVMAPRGREGAAPATRTPKPVASRSRPAPFGVAGLTAAFRSLENARVFRRGLDARIDAGLAGLRRPRSMRAGPGQGRRGSGRGGGGRGGPPTGEVLDAGAGGFGSSGAGYG